MHEIILWTLVRDSDSAYELSCAHAPAAGSTSFVACSKGWLSRKAKWLKILTRHHLFISEICTTMGSRFRPRPAFHRLQYVLAATESWAGAWELDYSFSTRCESASCLPIWSQLRRSPSHNCSAAGACRSCYVHYVTRNLRSLPHKEYV